VTDVLAERGYAVVRFDARGAGESEGSASWTCVHFTPSPFNNRLTFPRHRGSTEADDYRQLVWDLVLPLLFPPETAPESPESSSTERELLLCGYSFGSLAASACPPPSLPPSHPHARLTTSYLLISYPLSVLWALTFFRSGPFTTALRETVMRGNERILTVFGDRDQFSGVEKLRKWAGELDELAQGSGNRSWKAIEIEGADHFWLDRAQKIELLETIKAWVRRGPVTRL
jgi:alpha/beta superfamily hydrolase